jgi:hypothetical protein
VRCCGTRGAAHDQKNELLTDLKAVEQSAELTRLHEMLTAHPGTTILEILEDSRNVNRNSEHPHSRFLEFFLRRRRRRRGAVSYLHETRLSYFCNMRIYRAPGHGALDIIGVDPLTDWIVDRLSSAGRDSSIFEPRRRYGIKTQLRRMKLLRISLKTVLVHGRRSRHGHAHAARERNRQQTRSRFP